MNAANILSLLPPWLEWMVLFRLSAIRPWAQDTQMKAMFCLPEKIELEPFSHVVLTSHGRYLAPRDGDKLNLVIGSKLQDGSVQSLSLLDRHRSVLEALPAKEPDCLGIGGKIGLPPVMLHATFRDGYGEARAIFHRKPSENHYELLKSVGVEYQHGYPAPCGFVALFRNRLPTHIHAGALAGYTRTGNCNRFFLNHGEIDPALESGLIQASEARTACGRETGLTVVARLGSLGRQVCLAMTCQPPPPQKRFGYGDLVPLGFLLKALNQASNDTFARPAAGIRELLLARRHGMLWPFHSGRLVTSTDSVLILQALPDCEGVNALEQFSNGCGQYYPQLWSQTEQPGRMVINEANAHWCQPDFATTCLVRSLRAEVGLATVTPWQYLEEHFETRSGLYFANPYLTDWALANAIREDHNAVSLRKRLLQEIVGGMNDDYSFGFYDAALSTSMAIVALAALGCRGRLLRLAQLRLLEMMDPATGLWPQCIPFYSTFLSTSRTDTGTFPATDATDSSSQILDIRGSRHELSLYIDTHRMIATALAVIALGERCDPSLRDLHLRNSAVAHPRYKCRSQAEYVAKFALPPYTETFETRSFVA